MSEIETPRFTTAYIEAHHGDPIWEAIWATIKGWDIRREGAASYHGPTGDDVQEIYEAVDRALAINGQK